MVGKIPQSKGEDVERYLAHIEQKLLKKAAGLQKSGKEPEELCKTLDLVDKEMCIRDSNTISSCLIVCLLISLEKSWKLCATIRGRWKEKAEYL